jgi:hypothetical protein
MLSAMNANRITQHLPVTSRLPAASAAAVACNGFVVVPAVLVAAGGVQAEVYRAAYSRACEQVARRWRLHSMADTAYLWN